MAKVKDVKLHNNKNLAAIITVAVICFWCALLLLMIFWAIISSFKSRPEFSGLGYYENLSPLAFPKEWLWSNYKDAFEYISVDVRGTPVKLPGLLFNSAIYAVGTTLASTVTPMMVAYACAKYRFKLGSFLHSLVLVVMVIPIVGNLSSSIQVARDFLLYDTFWGMFFMRATWTNMYFLIFYTAFKSQPTSYDEAAKIDGAGPFALFWKIDFPLVSSVFVGVLVIMFMTNWNEYYIPMVYLPSHPVVVYALYKMQAYSGTGMTIPILIAGSVIVSLPTLVLFLVFKNKIMGNISLGGIKE